MDKQRLQAYYQLIQQLLSCPHGEEAAILQANRELLDVGFLELLKVGVEQMSTQEGQENRANRLLALASQLSEELDIPLTPEPETPVNEADFDTYFQFLLEVLKATEESRGNPQVVYPLLAANKDKLNLTFVELLRLWATNTLEEAEPDAKQFFAGVIVDFSNLIREFPLGNQADNIEIAITGYEIALTVFTRHTYQEQWATLQHNLGYAYCKRIEGDKPDNLDKAKKYCERALEVRTHSKFRREWEWANTKNILGNIYAQITQGDEAQNLEDAITCYLDAREVFNCHEFRIDWARIQNLLGNVYRRRIKGDIPDNLEQAIKCYEAALQVRTRCEFPREWATSQNGLGSTYLDRIKGEKPDNLEQAIKCYKAALEEITNSDFREDLAMIQHNIAVAYTDKAEFAKINEDKFNYAEEAIKYCELALEIRTYKDWAMTQNVLGDAYRIKNNLKEAIECHKLALKLYDSNSFPFDYSDTLLKLGIAYQNSQQLDLAYDTFKSAIANVEDLRGEIISGAESKRKHAEKWNQLYRRMVEVCLALDKEREAISYIERSKTRNLVELIAEKVDFTPIEYSEIQNLLDEKTAIIQFYIFNACFRAFIITKNNDKPIIWKSTEEDLDQFRDWINKYLTLYYSDRNKWRNDLNYQLTKLAEIFHINQIIAQVPKHIQKIIIIPHRYLHLLPFHAIPLSTNSEYLFDKYPEGVSYAPSCQLLNIAKERLSNPLLQGIQGNRTRLSNLFAIQNPNNNLPFTNIEVETIAASFDPQQILKNNEASKANLQETTTFNKFTNSQWLHFSCHGSFDLESPLKSALQLADSEVNPSLLTTSSSRYVRVNEETAIDLSKCLTLAEILELNLPQCYLVCLSACETGVIDFSNNSDEFIGLSSGFIKAGAVNIVSSLWNVEDFHTAILMIKLYENIANNPQDITLALNTAQQWLRQATQVQIIDWLKQKTEMEEEQKQKIINLLSTQYKPKHQPFNKPYFWAGFCAVSPVISPV